MRLSEDGPVNAHKGESDRGDRFRACAADVEKPESSRDDAGAAPTVDDLPASTVRGNYQTSRVAVPSPDEHASRRSVTSAAREQRDEEQPDEGAERATIHTT